MRLVKTDLRGKNSSEILLKAQVVLKGMKGNALFPAPTPNMADFEQACQDLQAAILAVADGGSKLAFSHKQQCTNTVSTMLKGLAAYVSVIAQGDAVIVGKAGFELRRESRDITRMPAPKRIRSKTGKLHGTIVVRWEPVAGVRLYNLYICAGNPTIEENWTLHTQTSSSRYVATGLAPLAYYWFRVEAKGAHTISPLSNTTSALSTGPQDTQLTLIDLEQGGGQLRVMGM